MDPSFDIQKLNLQKKPQTPQATSDQKVEQRITRKHSLHRQKTIPNNKPTNPILHKKREKHTKNQYSKWKIQKKIFRCNCVSEARKRISSVRTWDGWKNNMLLLTSGIKGKTYKK